MNYLGTQATPNTDDIRSTDSNPDPTPIEKVNFIVKEQRGYIEVNDSKNKWEINKSQDEERELDPDVDSALMNHNYRQISSD